MEKTESIDKKAAKAGLWYTVGNIMLKGAAFLSLPIFTRLLSTTDFGIYNTYIAYEQILTAIIGLGMYGTVKSAKIDWKERFGEYVSSIVSLIVMAFIVLLAATNILDPVIVLIMGYSRFIHNCLVLQSFGAALLFFYGATLNVEFRYKSFLSLAAFNTLGNILVSIVLILYVFPYERYLGRILGTAAPLIVISIIVILVSFSRGKVLYSKKYWKYALVIGLPLVPHVISQSLLSQFDRIMIKDMVGASEAGIYSYIYTICTILAVVSSSLENAWNPWVFLSINEGHQKKVKNASKDYIALFSILSIGFMCVMPEATKLFAGADYWSGIRLIFPITIGNYFIFLYMLPVNIEYYHKKTLFISIGTISAAAVNVVLNYIGIKLFGYEAAAFTTLLSYGLLFAFHWIIARKYSVEEVYEIKTILKNVVVVAVTGVVLMLLDSRFVIQTIVRYVIVLLILIVLILNKRKLIGVLKREK